MVKKIFTLALAALMVCGMFAGCAQQPAPAAAPAEPAPAAPAAAAPAEPAPAEAEGLTFGFANATMNNGFFVTINDTFKKQMEADGNTMVMFDCDWDNEKQLSQMEDLVNSGVDLIFLAPADVDGAHAGVQAAHDAGIPVIVLDNPLNAEDSAMVASTVASDNYQAGVVCADMLMGDYPDGAKVAVLTHTSNNAALARVNGFKDTVAANPAYEIVAELAGEGTIEDSIAPSEDILQAHPEVTAWFACNELSAMGALTAIEAAGKAGTIKIYSVDASPDGKDLLIDGSFAGLAAQSPIGIATKAYELALATLNGEEVVEQFLTECFEVRKADAEKTQGQWQ